MTCPAARRTPAPALVDDRLYLGDNGRVHCGALRCAGMQAHFSGIALDGQECAEVDAAIVAEFMRLVGAPPACEMCGAGVER